MRKWNDYNTANEQISFNLIPKGTLVKVHLKIKPGGLDNAELGWTGGWATQSKTTTSVYLSCDFSVMMGQYAHRKIWGMIGLHSDKSDVWAENGRSFIKAILNSANGITAKDDSEVAKKARQIESFGDLDGLVFLARVNVKPGTDGEEKNVIEHAITADHKEYDMYMSVSEGFPAESQPAMASNSSGKPADWA